MLEFEEFKKLKEGARVDGNKVKFDYNSNDNDELLNKFGKKVGKEKFIPFLSNTNELGKYPIYSVYKTKGISNSTDIIKALKKQSDKLNIDDEDYDTFIKRTAIFIVSKVLKPRKVDIIVTPKSSTNILNDIIKEIQSRMPHIRIMSESFIKPIDISKISIDVDNPKLTYTIRKSLERQLSKAKEDGSFQNTHRYDFNSYILAGTLEETLYEQSNGGVEYELRKTTCDSTCELSEVIENIKLKKSKILIHEKGTRYYRNKDEFHTVKSMNNCITFLTRKLPYSRYALVTNKIRETESCPFSIKLSESECFDIVEQIFKKHNRN